MGMTNDEAKNKMDFLKKAYQKLIDEKVDSGKLVGDGVSGEWKAETPLDEAYKDIIEALDLAIKALEQQRPKGRWIEQQDIHKHHYGWFFCSECGAFLMSSDGANYCSCCGAKMEDEG